MKAKKQKMPRFQDVDEITERCLDEAPEPGVITIHISIGLPL